MSRIGKCSRCEKDLIALHQFFNGTTRKYCGYCREYDDKKESDDE